MAVLMENMKVRYRWSHANITSLVIAGGWHDVICADTVADAILNWIDYGSHYLELRGESLRKRANVNRESVNS